MIGQEAIRKRATEWVRDYDDVTRTHEAGLMILALLDDRAALVAERDVLDKAYTTEVQVGNERLRALRRAETTNLTRVAELVAERDALKEAAEEWEQYEREGTAEWQRIVAKHRENTAQAVAERDRYRDALEAIAKFGVSFDAKGTRSKQVNEIARAALAGER